MRTQGFIINLFFSLLVALILATSVLAADYKCGSDLNGDGFVDAEGETSICTDTPQGPLCPVEATGCNEVGTCPLGDFPCAGGSCTETGTCASTTVPVTQYKCPATGQIYTDPNQCSSQCVQTAACTSASLSGGGNLGGSHFIRFAGSGSKIYLQGRFDTGYSYTWGSINLPPGVTASGATPWLWYYGTDRGTSQIQIVGSGDTIHFAVQPQLNYCLNGRFMWWSLQRCYQFFSGQITLSGATASGVATMHNDSCSTRQIYTQGNQIYFKTYALGCSQRQSAITLNYSSSTCPLGNYQCNGSPPQCSAPQACVTRDGTTVQYKCSLDGRTYPLESECTTSCNETATCGTDYACPLGDQYQCMDNSGIFQCSPNECVDLVATPPITNTTAPPYYQDDGPVDPTTGECLGEIMIFNGKPGQCRGAGVETMFFSCCNTSQDSWLFFQEYCEESEVKVAMAKEAGRTHYLGKICVQEWPLVGCVQRAEVHCVFNSKLGRIIHEQGRPQLKSFGQDGGWGTAESPNCRGFTPDEFQMLDFSKIDLSEYFGDIAAKATSTIQNNMRQNVDRFYQNIR